jgi:hypothetical protein
VFPHVGADEVRGLQRDVALLAVPVDSQRPETLARLEALATAPQGAASILALVRPEDAARCLDRVRQSSIVGLMASDASLAHIEFRLNLILEVFPERRQRERVEILAPADVTSGGLESREYCVSLSTAGMGIASRRPLVPNSELEIRLHPTGAEPLDLHGRVIHCLQEAASVPPFCLGVFFLRTSPGTKRRLEALIATAV